MEPVTGGSIQLLDRGRVLAELGPMSMVIYAAIGNVPQVNEAVEGAKISFQCLERIAKVKELLRSNAVEMNQFIHEPLANTMIHAVACVDDVELTPMAAVAGTIADEVADFLFSRGMTKVIVSNGGDVAIRLRGGEPVTVGTKDSVGESRITGELILDSTRESWGVATSGLGGRSFTCGIASAVTVVAENARIADAAATSIANNSFIEDKSVVQRKAGDIDADTDIPNLKVTVKVDYLSESRKKLGLRSALERADKLLNERIINGAYVVIQGMRGMTEFFKKRWRPLYP